METVKYSLDISTGKVDLLPTIRVNDKARKFHEENLFGDLLISRVTHFCETSARLMMTWSNVTHTPARKLTAERWILKLVYAHK